MKNLLLTFRIREIFLKMIFKLKNINIPFFPNVWTNENYFLYFQPKKIKLSHKHRNILLLRHIYYHQFITGYCVLLLISILKSGQIYINIIFFMNNIEIMFEITNDSRGSTLGCKFWTWTNNQCYTLLTCDTLTDCNVSKIKYRI